MSLPSDIQSQLAPRERVTEHQTIVEGVVYTTNIARAFLPIKNVI